MEKKVGLKECEIAVKWIFVVDESIFKFNI